ncbi:hypothetical protein [Anabaena sp. CCY 9402-a]|uniref:hypothetical protein n=1 Tax=Anabaena sp. CCY 9402-a TaxID=3103867 RepID=UPI0039C5DF99
MQEPNLIINQSEIVSLGASLRKIEQKILKQNSEEGKSKIWFQGEEPYFDVFFEFEHDEILWFQVTLRGKSLSWDRKNYQLQTGMTNELSIYDASFYAASKTIENDIKTDNEFIYLVKSILETRTEEVVFAKALELFN